MNIPTLRHVPKGVRDSWAGLVRDVFLSIFSDPSDLDAWRKSLMLPRCILASPARGGRTHWCDTQNLVKSRIRRWRAGEIAELWADALTGESKSTRHGKKPKTTSQVTLLKANARRARRAVEDGHTGKLSRLYPQLALLLPPLRCWMECYPNTHRLHLPPFRLPPTLPPQPTSLRLMSSGP